MADVNSADLSVEGVETGSPAKIPATKKQRAPRSQKIAVEPVRTASLATTAKPTADVPVKRSKQDKAIKLKPIETSVTDSAPSAKGATKKAGIKFAAKPGDKAARTSVPFDEVGDLVQLETENKRLRKILSEKLRAENAELRKRLALG